MFSSEFKMFSKVFTLFISTTKLLSKLIKKFLGKLNLICLLPFCSDIENIERNVHLQSF